MRYWAFARIAGGFRRLSAINLTTEGVITVARLELTRHYAPEQAGDLLQVHAVGVDWRFSGQPGRREHRAAGAGETKVVPDIPPLLGLQRLGQACLEDDQASGQLPLEYLREGGIQLQESGNPLKASIRLERDLEERIPVGEQGVLRSTGGIERLLEPFAHQVGHGDFNTRLHS